MSHFAYTRSGGVWNSGTSLLASELASLDAKTFAAINGDGGGTYAPSTPIIIGGSGLSIGTSFSVLGNAFFSHDVTIGTSSSDTLSVASAFALSGSYTQFLGTFALNAGVPATFHDNVTIGDNTSDTLTVNSTTNFVNGFTAGGNSTYSGTGIFSFGGTARLAFGSGTGLVLGSGSTATVQGDLTLSGAGTIVERVVLGTASSSTYSVSTADTVFVPNSLSGVYTYTLDHVGAVAGKKMRVALEAFSSGMEIDLLDIVTGRIPLSTRVKNAAGCYTSVDVQFISGQWKMTGFSGPF